MFSFIFTPSFICSEHSFILKFIFINFKKNIDLGSKKKSNCITKRFLYKIHFKWWINFKVLSLCISHGNRYISKMNLCLW